jgi:hypothetical protein
MIRCGRYLHLGDLFVTIKEQLKLLGIAWAKQKNPLGP